MGPYAIQFENVSRKFCTSPREAIGYAAVDLTRRFCLLHVPTDRLRKKEFWALRDVNFSIRRGEAVGLIGQNGAGKSTILKMIAGILLPHKGTVRVRDKVGALIEVGAGFHPFLTGRENIFVGGALLGMKRREIKQKLEEIVAFADIGEFIDVPVRCYSSGMYVRLGFSIAIHCRPDILLIDEVLAVGDAKFQRKCLDKLAELQKNGVAFVIVSHNAQAVEGIASRALFLHKGRLIVDDDAGVAIARYEQSLLGCSLLTDKTPTRSGLQLIKQYADFGTDEIKIKSVGLYDDSGMTRNRELNSDEPVNIRISLSVTRPCKSVSFRMAFINSADIVCCGTYQSIDLLEGDFTLQLRYSPLGLATGEYKISLALFDTYVVNPHAHGHYGPFSVFKKGAAIMPGVRTPLCWRDSAIEILPENTD